MIRVWLSVHDERCAISMNVLKGKRLDGKKSLVEEDAKTLQVQLHLGAKLLSIYFSFVSVSLEKL